MELVPHDELKPNSSFNFAPMIDFLFLMVSLFATLALSRAALYDAEVDLVELKPAKGAVSLRAKEMQQIHLSINATGAYKWMTDFQEYPMDTVQAIQKELARQYQMGVLPEDKTKTEILLHIDRTAPWDPIAKAIFAIRELGFSARPIYDSKI